MAQAKVGDKVRIHYCGILGDATPFDYSLEEEPFEFTIGREMVLSGLEKAVIGMSEGETKTILVPPEDGFGHYRRDLLTIVERSQIPDYIDIEVGKEVTLPLHDGTTAIFTIKDIFGDKITLDGNHPLAGKQLIFRIRLLEIL